MGCGLFRSINLPAPLRVLAERLNLEPEVIESMQKRFYDMCEECGRELTVDDFLHVMGVEKTTFAFRCFSIIDQDQSGVIDFKEFLIGLWNICSFDEYALLRFSFQLFDTDQSGYIELEEVEELIKSVQGTKFERHVMKFVRKVLKECDKNNDGRISMHELYYLHKQLNTLFLPAFAFQLHLREEFYGNKFWTEVAAKRSKDENVSSLSELIKMSGEMIRKQEQEQLRKENAKKRQKQWNGARCPLGTVVYETYGNAGIGSPIRVKKSAKVEWDGNKFVAASKSDKKRASPDKNTLLKQMKAINGVGSFYESSVKNHRTSYATHMQQGTFKRGLINASSLGQY